MAARGRSTCWSSGGGNCHPWRPLIYRAFPDQVSALSASAFASLLDRDLAEILRCPACGGDLSAEVVCTRCGQPYTVDRDQGFGSLLPPQSATSVKADIQGFWGDLYQQLYQGHEAGIDSAEMDRRMDAVEALFRARRHLATEEMPLDQLPGKLVLEIGSGGGAHSAVFKHHGASMVSVDITPERVMATARKLALVSGGEGRAYQADAERLPFKDGVFDIVYSNGVLHHSEDTDACIAEVFRVLKPGGLAVIMLYSRHSAIYWLQVAPRALLTGEMFRWPEPQWIGRLTEGKPKFGQTKNPITRVYSAAAIRRLFGCFEMVSLRKHSYQFDHILCPRATQMRHWVLRALGYPEVEGGIYVYGSPFIAETATEQFLADYLGWGWNLVARKPVSRD